MSSEEGFIKLCRDRAEELCTNGSHNFLCCVDGSEQAFGAFLTMLSIRRKYDNVTVFHAYKDDQQIFPVEYRSEEIKLKYEVELVGRLPTRRYMMLWLERNPGQRVIDCLKSCLTKFKHEKSYEPDFIFLGGVGLKGVKPVPTVLGYNTDLALRTLHVPCIIVKTPCVTPTKKWLMAVDGSDYSNRGLDILLQLVNHRDTLNLVYFYNEDDENLDSIKHYYEHELELYGPERNSMIAIRRNHGEALTHTMADYVNDSDCDFLALAPRAQEHTSSICNHMLNHVKCNIVLCKN
jgi:hypothetical protein